MKREYVYVRTHARKISFEYRESSSTTQLHGDEFRAFQQTRFNEMSERAPPKVQVVRGCIRQDRITPSAIIVVLVDAPRIEVPRLDVRPVDQDVATVRPDLDELGRGRGEQKVVAVSALRRACVK